MPSRAAKTLLLACVALAALPAGIAIDAAEKVATIAGALADEGRPASDRQLDAGRRPAVILDLLNVRRGDRVLDVLASPGYYSELLAQLVGPDGKVTAYDPPQFVASPGARSNWSDRIRRRPNIRQDLQPLHATIFDKNQYDRALLHLAYHETYWESARYGLHRMEPRRFARMLFEALRERGRIVIVDHAAQSGEEPRSSVDRYHRIDPAVVIADFEAAGFKLAVRSVELSNPWDDRQIGIFDPRVRGRTDRMILVFQKN
jgi:predicted methyltransferase